MYAMCMPIAGASENPRTLKCTFRKNELEHIKTKPYYVFALYINNGLVRSR